MAISQRALDLHAKGPVVLAHDHSMLSVAANAALLGNPGTLHSDIVPRLKTADVDLIGLVVGGDAPLFYLRGQIDDALHDPWRGTQWLIDLFYQELAPCEEELVVCLSRADIETARANRRIAVLLLVEGTGPCVAHPEENPLVALRTLHKLGVRSVQIDPVPGNPLFEPDHEDEAPEKLSQLGCEFLAEMNRLGMLVDVAHFREHGPLLDDIISSSTAPIGSSHGNPRTLTSSPWDAEDKVFHTIQSADGVCGVKTVAHLGEGKARPQISSMVRNLQHLISIVGVERITLGLDQFVDVLGKIGAERLVENLETLDKLPQMTSALLEAGLREDDVSEILGANWLRLLGKVLE